MQKELNERALEENKNIINEIVKCYCMGFKIIEIARMFHITYYKTRKILIDNDIRIRNRNERL